MKTTFRIALLVCIFIPSFVVGQDNCFVKGKTLTDEAYNQSVAQQISEVSRISIGLSMPKVEFMNKHIVLDKIVGVDRNEFGAILGNYRFVYALFRHKKKGTCIQYYFRIYHPYLGGASYGPPEVSTNTNLGSYYAGPVNDDYKKAWGDCECMKNDPKAWSIK